MVQIAHPWSFLLLATLPLLFVRPRDNPWRKAGDWNLVRLFIGQDRRRMMALFALIASIAVTMAGVRVTLPGDDSANAAAIAVPLNDCLDKAKLQANAAMARYDRIALLAYDAMPYALVPATADHNVVRLYLNDIEPDMAQYRQSFPSFVTYKAAALLPDGGDLHVFTCDAPVVTNIQNHARTFDLGAVLLPLNLVLFLLSVKNGLLILLLFAGAEARADWLLNGRQIEIRAVNAGVEKYRDKNYEEALRLWDRPGCAECLYNSGNALALSGDIPGAIKSYQAALALRPDHADAKFNLEYLLRAEPPPPPNAGRSGIDVRQAGGEKKPGDVEAEPPRASRDDRWRSDISLDHTGLLRSIIIRQRTGTSR